VERLSILVVEDDLLARRVMELPALMVRPARSLAADLSSCAAAPRGRSRK
jgi:hypothetical protein